MEKENKVANREVFCNTALYKDGPATRTKLTLDFSGVTKDDLVEYAIDSLVIKWQGSARRLGTKKENPVAIPKEATYLVPKPGSRAVAQMTPFEMLSGVFGKEKALDLVNKAGGNVEAVLEKLKALDMV